MNASGGALRAQRLGVLHAAATLAAVMVFLFVLFWAGAAFGMLPLELRALFGPRGAGSPTALLIGAVYALILGGVIGVLVAVFHNCFRFLHAVRDVERG